jgi:hypothetical protein
VFTTYPLGERAALSSLLVPASAGVTKPFHNPELLAGMGAILAPGVALA